MNMLIVLRKASRPVEGDTVKKFTMIFTVAFTLSGNATAGNIYRCVDAAGNVTFSQTACKFSDEGGKVGHSTSSPHQPLIVNDRYWENNYQDKRKTNLTVNPNPVSP